MDRISYIFSDDIKGLMKACRSQAFQALTDCSPVEQCALSDDNPNCA